jgi:hypothetical protein
MTDQKLTTSDLAAASATDRPEPDEAALEADAAAERRPLLAAQDTDRLGARWREIQTSFVDEPRESVAAADQLVADLMQQLAATFSREREQLESQWDRGDNVSTEELRVALTRYRSFFDRLLST